MGAAGKAHVAAHYSWPQVAEQTRQLYSWLASKTQDLLGSPVAAATVAAGG